MTARQIAKRVGSWYVKSLLFALWSGLCVSVGAAWMFAAIVAALPPQVRDQLAGWL
jgi:hypothetical protein